MKLKFLATTAHHDYTIDGENINSIPLSEIQDGESFALPEMAESGIHKAERIDGELFVTLEQQCTSYRYPVKSHDWRESDWIDSADYDPAHCYLNPISVEGKDDWYFELTENGWTVVQEIPPEPEPEEEEEPENTEPEEEFLP